MTYGSQGIQQKGRILEIGEEKGIIKGEYRQGERSKTKKGTSWKYRSTCEHCGVEFAGRKGGANRFCQQSCQHEQEVMKWLACSKCLASIGIGCKKASKILKISPSQVTRQWKKRGVVAARPQAGSWKTAMGLAHIDRKPNKDELESRRARREYERACMKEIKASRIGFDWSYEWSKEKARRKSLEIYHNLTEEQRAIHNARWKNRDKIERLKYLREWKRERRNNDPTYRIIEGFRSRLSAIARGKTQRTKDLIGCSSSEFRKYLQSQFKRGMSWDNYGTYWHVDHILPCASFDHTDERQIAQCWHWTNLRPLKSSDNLIKGCKITEPQMQLTLCAS